MQLGPLDRAELVELLTGLLRQEPDPRLVDQVYARSEGNPFFAEELVAAAGDGAAASPPPTLREVLLARVEGLPADTQAVLRVAAAAGREVDHELLAAVAGMEGPRLLSALRTAVAEQALMTQPDTLGCTFRHALLAEAVHDDLLPGERTGLHAELARVLQERPRAGRPRGAERGAGLVLVGRARPAPRAGRVRRRRRGCGGGLRLRRGIEGGIKLALEGADLARRHGIQRGKGAFLLGNAAEFLLDVGRLDEAEPLTRQAHAIDTGSRGALHARMLRATRPRPRGAGGGRPSARRDRRARLGAGRGTVLRASSGAAHEARVGRGPARRCAPPRRRGPGCDRRGGRRADIRRRAVRPRAAGRGRALGRAGAVRWGRVAGPAARGDGPARSHLPGLRRVGAARRGRSGAACSTRTTRSVGTRPPSPSARSDARCPRPTRTSVERRRSWPAAIARARAALHAAWETARQLGAELLRADVERLARRGRIDLGGAEPVEVTFALTPREAEVLRLVAAGRSNRQIGEALFISTKTASVHVSNILAKLGVEGRGEAGALAHRLGLAETQD